MSQTCWPETGPDLIKWQNCYDVKSSVHWVQKYVLWLFKGKNECCTHKYLWSYCKTSSNKLNHFHKHNMNPLEVCMSAFLTKTPCCPAMLNTVGNTDITPVYCWKKQLCLLSEKFRISSTTQYCCHWTEVNFTDSSTRIGLFPQRTAACLSNSSHQIPYLNLEGYENNSVKCNLQLT